MTLAQVMKFIKDIMVGIGVYQWIVMALILGVGFGVVKSVLAAIRR